MGLYNDIIEYKEILTSLIKFSTSDTYFRVYAGKSIQSTYQYGNLWISDTNAEHFWWHNSLKYWYYFPKAFHKDPPASELLVDWEFADALIGSAQLWAFM